MRRILLALLLAFLIGGACSAADPSWQELGVSNDYSAILYIDKNSINRTDEYSQAWTKFLVLRPTRDNGASSVLIRSRLTKDQQKCDTDFTMYDANGATIASETNMPCAYEKIAPNSLEYSLWNYLFNVSPADS